MDSLKDRINNAWQLLRKKGIIHTKIELGEKIGMNGKSQIYDTFAGRDGKLTVPILERVADAFPNVINKEYMQTGTGPIEIDTRDTRPHFSDLPAAAGFMAGPAQIPVADIREFIPIFGDYNYSVEIRGDSMLPDIHSGDVAFCELLNDKNELKLGEVYLVDTTEGAAIKVIADEGRKDLTLHSFNPDYQDYKVPKESIIRIARVVGITRKF